MKVYLVGGAVRDRLLGLSVHERDWVVVGGTPEDLTLKGFKQVGRDFPVFLHPKTKEEYALARTEKKSSPGYHGFICSFDPKVTLEEDLARRDLTINAMAMDDQGTVIDPYQGQIDLSNKILRHVSPAFVEDPVRILRIARFAARFHHLGFRLANETRCLMYSMVRQGELEHLTAERVWLEWQKSLFEKNPEQFIEVLRSCDALRVVLPELNRLFGVPNPCKHHPEIDSGVHTLMVLEAAVPLSRDPVIRFAALVHDLGKGVTPMGLWPKHHGHEEGGVPVIENLCERLRIPSEYKHLAVLVSRVHLLVHRILELRATTIVSTLEKMDAFRRPERFEQVLMVCQADASGRGKSVDYTQANLWRQVFAAVSKVDVQAIMQQGYSGQAIKHKLHEERVAIAQSIKDAWE
jgi:tRNA nucleotidyltransferase (CCA-adding enzyme)